MKNNGLSALILGVFLFAGLAFLGYFIGSSVVKFKEYERSVRVKGLSEREVKADIVIWSIRFRLADNDMGKLNTKLESDTKKIVRFLQKNGIGKTEISVSTPNVKDKLAQEYGEIPPGGFRYFANRDVTVYSKNIDTVRKVKSQMADLAKSGILFVNNEYSADADTEYIFTGLNKIKPEMIEEATKKAREVAEKFAADSNSKLGKIKRASQGQFSIFPRDRNNPHIKKVRVVSTVEYYLSD